MLSRQTLRTRLTVLLVALLLIACATVGVATTLALRSFLLFRLDQQLDLAGSRYATALEHNDNDADNPETSTIGQPVGTLGARVLDGRLTAIGVVPESGAARPVPAPDRTAIAALAAGRHIRTIGLPTLGRYRVQVIAGRDGDVLVTGLPLRPVDDTLHDVVLVEAIAFLLVVAVIGLGGAIAVRRSLRPLERVAATALRVSEMPLATGDGQLPVRVPPASEGTEVGQVATAVNAMLERVEEALMQRQRSEDRLRRFVADASHELRTPLSVVRSHSELIQHTTADLPEPVRRSLQRIESETRRMGALVDDLLLLARLDAGQELDHGPVDLSRLAINAVSDAQVDSPEHRWALDLPEEPVIITGDGNRLHEVLANLLANAGAHTPPGTAVTVSLAPDPHGEVLLSVRDTGPGIAGDLLPTVTERFVRGQAARSHANGSSGLGLAIVAGVVAAHDGTVTITSTPGDTTVTVALPARPAAG